MLRKNFHSAGPQSNVTRMARCLKRKCHDGTPQVIVYDPGVGSSASKVDQWFGGAFGMGLEQNIREMYNFICNNFVDGDEIILIGFSRGAFTARSVADLIGTIGLLTPEGQDYFNSIFKDYENIADTDRDLDKYLTKLDPFVDEGDGSKAEWVAKRKRAYVKFLKGAGVSHFWSSCFSPSGGNYSTLILVPLRMFLRISSIILSLSSANSADESFLPSFGSFILLADTFGENSIAFVTAWPLFISNSRIKPGN